MKKFSVISIARITMALLCFMGLTLSHASTDKATAKKKSLPTKQAAKNIKFGAFSFNDKPVGLVLAEITKKHPEITFDIGQYGMPQDLSNINLYANYIISFSTNNLVDLDIGMRALQKSLGAARKRIDPTSMILSQPGESPLRISRVIEPCSQVKNTYILLALSDAEGYCPQPVKPVVQSNDIYSSYALIQTTPLIKTISKDSFKNEESLKAFQENAEGIKDILNKSASKPITLKVSPQIRRGAVTVTTDSPKLLAQIEDLAAELDKPQRALTTVLYSVEFRELSLTQGKTVGYSLAALSQKLGLNYQAALGGTQIITDPNTQTPGMTTSKPFAAINRSNYSAVIHNLNTITKSETVRDKTLTGALGQTTLFADGGTMVVTGQIRMDPTPNTPYGYSYSTTTREAYGIKLELTTVPVIKDGSNETTYQVEIKYSNVTPNSNSVNNNTRDMNGSTTVEISNDEVILVAGSSNLTTNSEKTRGFWIMSADNSKDQSRSLALMVISIKVGNKARVLYPPLNTMLYTPEKVQAYLKNPWIVEPQKKEKAEEPKQPPSYHNDIYSR